MTSATLTRRGHSLTSRFAGLPLVLLTIAAAMFGRAGAARAQDPTAAGPFTVVTTQYDRGDTAFTCTVAEGCTGTVPNAEIRAEVYYPSNLAAGPFPLVIFLHGNHTTCYDPANGNTDFGSWPCTPPMVPVPSHRGYDYIGRILASHGYIVASISANGINARTAASSGAGEGIPERGRLIDAHLRIWSAFNTVGSSTEPQPFASAFIGRVDMNRVGTMGHSRGGGGVVNHFAAFGAANTPYKVRAILPIAPTNTFGDVATGVNLGVLLSYCDGDVFTLEGSLFYDRARYVLPMDPSTKSTLTVLGGNHNFYNTVWTPDCWNNPGTCWSDNRGVIPIFTVDDYPGNIFDPGLTDPVCGTANPSNVRLSPPGQRSMGLGLVAAFFRYHLGGETAFGPLLRGDTPPQFPMSANVNMGYHPPATQRLDLNRFNDASELSLTTLASSGGVRGAVTPTSLETYLRCGFDQADPCFPGSAREAHLTDRFSDNPTLSRVQVSWNAPTDTLVNNLPAGTRNVSRFDVVQFRAGVDYRDPRNAMSSPPRDFSVVLEDGVRSVSVSTAAQLGNNDLGIPAGTAAPTAVMNTVRVPLDAFSGVNLADLRRVTLRFDHTSGGTVLFSDLAFAREPHRQRCQASQSFTIGDRAIVTAPGADGPAILNSGTGEARVSFDAQAVGISSVGPVRILDRAIVNGRVESAGTVTVSPLATVNGTISPFASVSLPGLPTLPAFPPPTGGSFSVNSGQTRNPGAGSYGTVTVSSGGTLNLVAGSYFFTSLTVNGGGRINVTPTTQVFVQSTLALGVSFTNTGGSVQPIMLGFAGTSLSLNVRFDGTLIAPNATLSLGSGAPITFTGSFFARVLQLNNDMRLVCQESPAAGPAPPASCSDGIRNGTETDVDCGGAACPKCATGSACSVGSDCQSGACTNGTCRAPGNVTGALNIFADWGGGYCATIRVTNGAAVPTTNWSVTLNTNQSTIYTSWNGAFSGASGAISVVPGFDWNRAIPAGATNDSVGFCANRTVPGSGTTPFVLSASGTF